MFDTYWFSVSYLGDTDRSYGSWSLKAAMSMLDEQLCVIASELGCSLGYLYVAASNVGRKLPQINIIDTSEDGEPCVGWIWHDYQLSFAPWWADTTEDVFDEIDPDHQLLDLYPD